MLQRSMLGLVLGVCQHRNFEARATTLAVEHSAGMSTALYHTFRQIGRYFRQAANYVRQWFVVHGALITVSLLLVVLLGFWLVLPVDDECLRLMHSSKPTLKYWASQLSYYGDFAGFNVLLFVGLLIIGKLYRSPLLIRLAVASLLCALLSGLTANVLRFSTGRPRPSAKTVDVLRGPSFSSDFHALPSAHTATAFGGALPLMMSIPVVGTPLTIIATGVGWSRLQLGRHHPSDVLASVFIAFTFSVPLSRWALRYPPPTTLASTRFLPPRHVIAPAPRSH